MGELGVAPVLDTDVLTYRVTAVSALELALGRSYAADPDPVNALVSVPCLPLGRRAGVGAGALLHDLRAAGQEIGMRDAMQAAICLEADLPLVTRNTRHFERVEGLEVHEPDQWHERRSG